MLGIGSVSFALILQLSGQAPCPDEECDWRLVPDSAGRPLTVNENGVYIAYPMPVDPDPDPDQDSDFWARCNAPGVILCDPLDTDGPWGTDASGTRRLMPNPDGTTGIPTDTWSRNWRGVVNNPAPDNLPALDPDMSASGTGSLRFEVPSNSRPGGGGSFVTNFSDDLSQQFGTGEQFYVQYRVRFNCDWLYMDCDPNSPDYKTTRRAIPRESSSSSSLSTFFKHAIIAGGDQVLGGRSSNACDDLQIVLDHAQDHALSGYHACGWYRGFTENTGERPLGFKQVDIQPGGDYECWRVPDPTVPRTKDWGYTGPNCFYLESDQWMTIQVEVTPGPPQRSLTGNPQSHIRVWASLEGAPRSLVIDHDFYMKGLPDDPTYQYGKIWLLPFTTEMDPDYVHPLGVIWYDELIVSRESIPWPGGEAPPPPPICDLVALESQASSACPNGYTLDESSCTFACLPDSTGVYSNVPIPQPGQWACVADSTPAAGVFPTDDPTELPWGPYGRSIRVHKAKDSFYTWTGMAWDESGGRWWAPAHGGHRDSGQNGVYQYSIGSNSWDRLFDPQPLDGPSTYDSDGNELPECKRPAIGPPSTHNYSGAVYLPPSDGFPDGQIVNLGASPYCRQAVSAKLDPGDAPKSTAFSFNLDTGQWTRLPNHIRTGKVAATIDSQGFLIAITSTDDTLQVINTTTWDVVHEHKLGYYSDGMIDLDEVDRGDGHGWLYLGMYNVGLVRMPYVASPSGVPTIGRREVLVDSRDHPYIALQVHSPTGNVAMWEGGCSVLVWDRETKTAKVSSTSPLCPAPVEGTAGVYGKWNYHEPLDVFFGMAHPDHGMCVYRLP